MFGLAQNIPNHVHGSLENSGLGACSDYPKHGYSKRLRYWVFRRKMKNVEDQSQFGSIEEVIGKLWRGTLVVSAVIAVRPFLSFGKRMKAHKSMISCISSREGTTIGLAHRKESTLTKYILPLCPIRA